MWQYGLYDGLEILLPPGCSVIEVATYVCPFQAEYVGCVMLIGAADSYPAPYVLLVNAIHGETTDYQDHVMTDNLFLALMEFESAKVSLEVAVNSYAMANIMRVSQWGAS